MVDNSLILKKKQTQKNFIKLKSFLFCRENPAQVIRLMVFVNRELIFLLNNTDHQMSYVLDTIKDELTRSDILSAEFRDRMEPYFRRRTSHFIHELHNFARSPYDMFGYDLVVRYRRRPSEVTIELSTSGSENDEPVIINDVPLSNLYVTASALLSSAEPGTSSSAMEARQQNITIHSNPSQRLLAPSHSSNPVPPHVEAPSEPISISSSDEDDCQFVLSRKPPHLRTPEYVSLNSDSDSDVVFINSCEEDPNKPTDNMNLSAISAGPSTSGLAGTSSAATSSNSNPVLPLKKRRNISEARSSSSEDNKPLILQCNRLQKEYLKRRNRRKTAINLGGMSYSSSEPEHDDDDDCDCDGKAKERNVKQRKLVQSKEVALHKYIKGAVNQGASTSSGVGVKKIYENSTESGTDDDGKVWSSDDGHDDGDNDDDDDEDEDDERPLKQSDRAINIKIIKNQNSFCSVVNEKRPPMKRKSRTSKGENSSSSSKKSSTKKRSSRNTRKKSKHCSSDDEAESIDVVTQYDSTASSSS